MLVGVPSGGVETVDLAGGVLFSLVSAVSYAAVVQIGHVLTRRHEPLRINAVSFAIGAAVLVAVAVPSGVRPPDLPTQWLLLVYLGVFPSVTAYALFLRGMRVTSATAASILVLLEPLVAALLAAAIFGERLSPLGVAGGALMCAGFLALVRNKG
jgi:drug/metabolite transporter, DME family